MAGFFPVSGHEGKQDELPMAASVTVVRGEHVKFSSGYLTNGAAGDNTPEYIAQEDKTSSGTNGATKLIVLPAFDSSIRWRATTGSTTPVQATHVGNEYDFLDKNDIDLGATTDKVFKVSKIVDAANYVVEGYFLTRE